MGSKRSRRWVWRAIDPESKLLLAIETGVLGLWRWRSVMYGC